MLNESLWNQPHRLSPQQRKFSHESYKFKKTIQDFDKTDRVEKDEKF